MISLIVADDRALFREAVRRLFSDCDDIRAEEADASVAALLERLDRVPAQVVLLGAGSFDHAAAAVVRAVADASAARVVLLLGEPGPQAVAHALRAGVAGVCTTDLSSDELVAAIRRVAAGERYLAPGLDRASERRRTAVPGLSRRELEVLQLLGAGRTSRQIAEQLGLSPKTISTYRSRIMEKLNLRGTAEIVRFALERGLAD